MERYEFIGEVSGTHRKDGIDYAFDGEVIKFTFRDIIGADGDFKVKISTETYARNFGEPTELWLSEIKKI